MSSIRSINDDPTLQSQRQAAQSRTSASSSLDHEVPNSDRLLAERHSTPSYSACDPLLDKPDEEAHILSRIMKSDLPPSSAWRLVFQQEVARDRMLEFQLLALTVATGIQDAATFTTFSVFTSKQTGNTLFLALYAFNHPLNGPQIEENVLMSISLFLLGGAFFGHLGRKINPRRRIWLLATNLFQTILMFGATALRYWGPRVGVGPAALGTIAMISFASSGQIASAVGVGMAEINTTMITGSLIQLSNDRDVFKPHNRARDRRVLFYLSLLAGCFIGAAALLKETSLAILLAGTVKGLVTVSFLFNRGVIAVVEDRTEGLPGNSTREELAIPVSTILWGD